jgi:hypothetical protein
MLKNSANFISGSLKISPLPNLTYLISVRNGAELMTRKKQQYRKNLKTNMG